MRNKVTESKKLTTLSHEEAAFWTRTFTDYVEAGQSEAVADRHAWEDAQLQFPRLKQFDGCGS